MGRRKVSVEYIQKDKKRSTTYDKRKKGLLKKAYELATLCDVPLCMIIYPRPNSDPATYPEKEEEVAAVINRYLSGSREDNAKRRLNLQQGLALGNKPDHPPPSPCPPPPIKGKGKAGGDGGGGAYPTWYPALDGLSRDDLVNLGSVLDCKLRQVEERMRPASLFYNANAAAAPGGSDHGGMMRMMQWPTWQSDHIGNSSTYDPNIYCAQLGSSLSHPDNALPLTALYTNTSTTSSSTADLKFDPNPGLKWYHQV